MNEREIVDAVQIKLPKLLSQLTYPAFIGPVDVELCQRFDRQSYELTARVEIRPAVPR